jgi:hypothetical protein
MLRVVTPGHNRRFIQNLHPLCSWPRPAPVERALPTSFDPAPRRRLYSRRRPAPRRTAVNRFRHLIQPLLLSSFGARLNLRVLNAIVRTMDAQGFPVKRASNMSWPGSFSATVLEKEVTFCLRRESHRLALDILGPSCGLRNTWRDGKRNCVENCIAEFVCTLACLAALRTIAA